MILEIEIDEKEVTNLVKRALVDELKNRILNERCSNEMNLYRFTLREALNQVCLEKRDELFDKVVEKTSDKIIRKAVKDKIDKITKAAEAVR